MLKNFTVAGLLACALSVPAYAKPDAKRLQEILNPNRVDDIERELQLHGIQIKFDDPETAELRKYIPKAYMKAAIIIRAINDAFLKKKVNRTSITEAGDRLYKKYGKTAVGAEYTTRDEIRTVDRKVLISSRSTTYHVDKSGPNEIDHLYIGPNEEFPFAMEALEKPQQFMVNDYTFRELKLPIERRLYFFGQ